ncbi:MAG: HD domain-containing protein, partial [Tissierellia bacterium]|nr:HD domain-containing protein [Tissierellia bacterium]
AFLIFIVFMVLFFVSFNQLNKYLIEPLNALYEGIKNFGLLDENTKKSLTTKDELTPIIEEINSGINKLDKLIELIENLNQDVSFEGILNYIYVSFIDFIPYSHIGIALLKDDGRVLEASFGISDPMLEDLPKKLAGIRANLSETSLESIVTNDTPRVINDLDLYVKNKEAEYNKVLLEAGIKSSISLPLKINHNPVGIIFFSSVNKDIYEEKHITFLKTLSNSISISLNKNIFIDELLYSTLIALTKMVEARDEDTGDHLERMKQYTVRITEFLMKDHVYDEIITLRFLMDIERFSQMHDIGKVGVRDGILLKPGPLTVKEFAEMKQHTIYGADVLKTAEGNIAKRNQGMFKMGIEIAEGHHEKWDGTGYPYQKSGTDIPLSARIVAVADVFDALTSKRPYKEAFDFDKSFDIIVKGSGKNFDPNIVDSVINHKNELFELYMSFNK